MGEWLLYIIGTKEIEKYKIEQVNTALDYIDTRLDIEGDYLEMIKLIRIRNKILDRINELAPVLKNN